MPVALVTGGSRGIGLGITRALLTRGYAVSILATRPEPEGLLTDLHAETGNPNVLYTQGSVADLDDHHRYLDATLERLGRVDLLVNNAGVSPSVRNEVLEANPESFDRVLGINLRGPYFLTQLVANQMISQDQAPDYPVPGTIINVSSISATAVSTNRGEYCVSKAGVAMATKVWAVALAEHGILVYEVRPGVVATDMTAGVSAKYDAMFEGGMAPIARWGTPEDVAGAVVQLAAGAMPYSTGDVIDVGGGMQIPRL